MSIDQATNDKNAERISHAIPLAIDSETDAVDMELLNALEELQVDDGSDLIIELIDLYLNELPRRVTEIREAALGPEGVTLKRAAHTLKGSSGNLGVRHVAALCQNLESIDRDDSPQTIAALVGLLEYEAARANASLGAVRQRRLG